MIGKLKHPIIFTAVSNLITLIVSVFVFHPYFEEDDDAVLAMICEGAYGHRDYHTIYTNPILGRITAGLQGICPSVRWHSVLEYLFIFLTLSLVTYVLVRRCEHFGYLLSVILQLTVGYEAYVAFQYTKAAALIAAGALLCMLLLVGQKLNLQRVRKAKASGTEETVQKEQGAKASGTEKTVQKGQMAQKAWSQDKSDENWNKIECRVIIILAYVCFTYAFLLREEPALIASAVMGIVGICDIIRSVRSNAGRYVIAFAPALAVVVILHVVNSFVYEADPEWKAHAEYNAVRTKLVDNRCDALDYTKYGEALSDIGVSENDALMYVTYQFADTSELDNNKLEQIVETAGRKVVDVDFCKAFAANIYDECFAFSPLVIGLLLLAAYCVAMRICSRWIDFALEGAFAAMMLFIYQYSGRWNHRLVAALGLALVMAAVYYLDDGEVGGFEGSAAGAVTDVAGGSKRYKTTAAFTAVVIVAVVNVGMLLGNIFEYNEYMRSQAAEGYPVLEEYVAEHKDTLFVYDTFSLANVYKYRVFEPCNEGRYDNMISCGGWMTNTPITNGILTEYGYDNPFEALASGDDKVVLIDNLMVLNKVIYLQEHYGGDGGTEYRAEAVDEIGGYKVYRIVEE